MKRIFPSLIVMVALTLPVMAHSQESGDGADSQPWDNCEKRDFGKNLAGFEKDQKILACKVKVQKTIEKTLAITDRQLRAIQKVQDPKVLTGDYQFTNFNHDCFSSCEPASQGGQCSDVIFTKYMGIIADSADPMKVDASAFNSYYSGKYDDTASKNLCGAIQQTINKTPSLTQNISSCQSAISHCRFNARDAIVAELKKLRDRYRMQADALDDDIDVMRTRLTEGCPDCGPSYYQRVPVGFDQMSSTVNGLNPSTRDTKATDQGAKNTPDAATGTSQQTIPTQAGSGDK